MASLFDKKEFVQASAERRAGLWGSGFCVCLQMLRRIGMREGGIRVLLLTLQGVWLSTQGEEEKNDGQKSLCVPPMELLRVWLDAARHLAPLVLQDVFASLFRATPFKSFQAILKADL